MDIEILLFCEVIDLILSLNDHCQRRSLDPANRQSLAVGAGEQPCRIDSDQPVSLAAAESCNIKRVICTIVFQIGKAVLYGTVLH